MIKPTDFNQEQLRLTQSQRFNPLWRELRDYFEREQNLLRKLNDNPFDILAPMIFAGECFYDIWGFRADGCRFGPFYPFHHTLAELHAGIDILVVDSVGSCFAAKGDIARRTHVLDNNALVGWCDAARKLGARIGVIPTLKVVHP